MNDTVFLHADRKKPKIRPLKAYGHLRKLIADKEDTEQVFHIIEALNGGTVYKDFKNFAASSEGAARIAQRRYLPPMLDDHTAMAKLPADSVGAAYLKFMTTEGLSAAGLVAEYDKFGSRGNVYDDQIQWYLNRKRDTHDLFHILTGYGRDALGEACVLSFSYGQNGGLGVTMIGYMIGRQIKKEAPRNAPIMRAVREGRQNGRLATKILKEDIAKLLAEPLVEARERLGINPPEAYYESKKILSQAQIEPLQVSA